MTIGVECPHCESVYQLQPELLGQSMRCPNPDCREIFTVASRAPVAAPPVDEMPIFEAEAVEEPSTATPPVDEMPIFEAEMVPPELPKAMPIPTAAKLPSAKSLPAPNEVHWSADAEIPFPKAEPTRPKPVRKRVEDVSEIPIRTRPVRSQLPKLILIGMVIALIGIGVAIAGFFYFAGLKSEGQGFARAEELYKESKFNDARKEFEELATKYPNSPDAPKYDFFGKLSAVQSAVMVLTVRENPTPAHETLQKFLKENGSSPFAEPGQFGTDIVQAGQKLCGAYADNATERMKKFQLKRDVTTEMTGAEASIARGRELIPDLEKYRNKSGLSFDDLRKRFDDVEALIRKERERLVALAPWRNLDEDPTDERIDEFERAMKAAGLAADGEAKGLAQRAKIRLRELVAFSIEKIMAKNADDPNEPLTIAVSTLGSPRVVLPPEDKRDVVAVIANGILYAVEANCGEKLWTTRVASQPRSSETPYRVKFADGATDWLLVPSDLDGRYALTARKTFTGEAVWTQALPAAILGKPVAIGGRLFLALQDSRGTILEFDLSNGEQLSRCELRQPIGGGIAAVRGKRASNGFLIVPGDARRIFVFEVGKEADNGRRMAPQISRVFDTKHPKDSLRGAPLAVDPDDPTPPRRVILTQTNGPSEMKIRSFTLPALAELAQAQTEGEAEPNGLAEVAVPGWSWFPPVSDGERLAVATDNGKLAVFGLNLPGNTDAPVFPLPGAKTDSDPLAISRGLIAAMDEDSAWAILGGQLLRVKASSEPKGGYKFAVVGTPIPLGEPVAAAEVRPALGLGYVAVRTDGANAIQLSAFDLETGKERWRRQLGVYTAGPLIAIPDGHLLIDRSGGAYSVTSAKDLKPGAIRVLEKAEPLAAVAGEVQLAVSADSKTVWIAIPEAAKEGVNYRIRRIVDGKAEAEKVWVPPSKLAGQPLAFDGALLLPLANGFLHRLNAGEIESVQIGVWRGATAKPDSIPYLGYSNATEFFVSNGGNQTFRKKWDANEKKLLDAGGPWESSEAVTGPAIAAMTDAGERLIVSETSGIAAFDPSKKLSPEPIRRWKGVDGGAIPKGAARHLIAVGKKVVYSVEGQFAVLLNPNDEAGATVILPLRAGDEIAAIRTSDEGKFLITDLSGTLREFNGADGKWVNDAAKIPGAPIVTGAATRIEGNRYWLTYSDGSIAEVKLQSRE